MNISLLSHHKLLFVYCMVKMSTKTEHPDATKELAFIFASARS